jgi:putative component of toxin-antitoxin plasmid stabilization module
MSNFYFVILLSSLSLLACKSASKAYEKGNYTNAIELAVKKLQKDPNDYDSRQILKNAYANAVAQHEDQVRILSNSKSESRFESIYSEYRYLQNLYDLVRRYPSAASVVQAKDYSEYLETYRDKAAEVHVNKALKHMEEKHRGKLAYRDAYNEYRAALRLKPDDFELRQTTQEVLDMALTKVLVIPIESYRTYGSSGSYQLRNFQEDIMRTLVHHLNNDFVRFYSEWDARNKNVEPDQVLELNLSRIQFGQPHDQSTVREVSKEVVVKETVYKPDSVVKQMGKVYARITTTKRTLISEGDLVISIRDTKGRMIWNDRFTGEHRWQTEFTSYTGDERALSDADRTQINKQPSTSPQQDEVMGQLFQQIQNDLSYRLRNYYSRF